ncbi:hypothetical protein I302_102235 [Kwoniella bestiolae CBS 10118]|uniref:Uncharacterized protein n=1 Tax=Kwoniella bestiolae CBS 10118 TaxID=1296100 RepID=A0A1B9GEJ5_9TREE|nr:hypothetical protein I302_00924 [Kwoniella bestiolae CBS 10118]OCF29419.1 hypothetical protein I302_00924 [Kwoniella bestiolae CBS 10118]
MAKNKSQQPNQPKPIANSQNKNDTKGKPTLKQDTYPIIPQKDLFQRINYTYQASIFLQSLGSSSSSTTTSVHIGGEGAGQKVGVRVDRKGKRKAIESPIDIPNRSNLADQEEERWTNGEVLEEGTRRKFRQLARINVREMNHMTVHNQLKLDPSLKRSICKSCGTILIPGLTSRIRNRPNRNTFSITHHTCLTCLSSLSIPSPPIPTLSAGDKDHLDGPVRSNRRRKASRRGKPVFHERERSGTGGESGRMGVGHTLWKGDKRLEGWGPGVNLAGNGNGNGNETQE